MKKNLPFFALILGGGIFILILSFYTSKEQSKQIVNLKKDQKIDSYFPEERLELGKNLFATNCASCHGSEGIGADLNNPLGDLSEEGNYVSPALNANGHAWLHSDNQLKNLIRYGSYDQESPMRGNPDLSSEEINSLVTYVKSLWPEYLLNFQQEIGDKILCGI